MVFIIGPGWRANMAQGGLVVVLFSPLRCEDLGFSDLGGGHYFSSNIEIKRRFFFALRFGK